MNEQKTITWSYTLMFIGGIIIGWYIGKELGIASGQLKEYPHLDYKYVEEPIKTITSITDEKENLDILVSKYAQLYDSCRYR